MDISLLMVVYQKLSIVHLVSKYTFKNLRQPIHAEKILKRLCLTNFLYSLANKEKSIAK